LKNRKTRKEETKGLQLL